MTDRTCDAPPDDALLFRDDFENGAEHWEATDPAAWKIANSSEGGHVYELAAASKYKPQHRSPLNFSLVRELYVDRFVLEVRVRSTAREYDHRDLCLFFGYQSPSRFYYVHFGKKTDDHANQIFIVNDAPRTKISTETTPGTPWNDAWHQIRVTRRVDDGTIDVFFDDMEKPVMRAKDTTFRWGRLGVGSFDDVGQFDEVRVFGRKVKPPAG